MTRPASAALPPVPPVSAARLATAPAGAGLAVNQPGVCVICGRRFVSKRGHMIVTGHWPKVVHLYDYGTQISYACIYDVTRRKHEYNVEH